ncbi:MAG: putative membrane protein YdjX (TVP38/TMEM64 family) [Candidatus Endobugula sp.]|jgi:uncharacterized membrane protein YdjX (TVP38/TMEM64 family)
MLLIITLTIVALFYEHISLSYIQSNTGNINAYIKENYVYSMLIAMAIYFLCCSLPMPFVSVVTIAIGYFLALLTGC